MNEVQKTLLFPILGRRRANNKWPMYFNDSHSKRICDELEPELLNNKDMGDFPAIVYALRYKNNVDIAKDFIKEHPRSTIVNLGAGLDSLFDDIDNGQINYYSIDFPDVIELRKKYLDESDRNINIASSILDFSWMQKVKYRKEDGILFLAAGVIYYFRVEEVKDLLTQIGLVFKKAIFSFDNESPYLMKKSNKMVKKSNINAPMHFMICDPYIIKTFSEDIKDIKISKDFSASLKNRKHLPLSARLSFFLLKRGYNMYQVTLTFY